MTGLPRLAQPRGLAARTAALLPGPVRAVRAAAGLCPCGAPRAPACVCCDPCQERRNERQRERRRARAGAEGRGQYRCGRCGERGHNVQGCAGASLLQPTKDPQP